MHAHAQLVHARLIRTSFERELFNVINQIISKYSTHALLAGILPRVRVNEKLPHEKLSKSRHRIKKAEIH